MVWVPPFISQLNLSELNLKADSRSERIFIKHAVLSLVFIKNASLRLVFIKHAALRLYVSPDAGSVLSFRPKWISGSDCLMWEQVPPFRSLEMRERTSPESDD